MAVFFIGGCMSFRIFLILFIVFKISLSEVNTHINWLFPFPQNNHLNDVVIFDDSCAIAIGDLGIIIFTSDYGMTWANSQIPIKNRLTAITQANKNTFWISGNYGTVLKSLDRGKTWIRKDIGNDTSTVADIFFYDNTYGWAYNYSGITFYTDNGGSKWNHHNKTSLRDGKLFFLDKQLGYHWNSPGVEKTESVGAKSWETLVSSGGFSDIDVIKNNHWWCAKSNGYIKYTEDDGKSWKIDYKCNGKRGDVACRNIKSVQGKNISVNTFNYASRKNHMVTSDDSGSTWKYYNMELNRDVLFRAIDIADNGFGLIVGTDGHIFKTMDKGNTWKQLSKDLTEKTLLGSFALNSDYCWVGGFDNLLLRSSNGGKSWQNMSMTFDTLVIVNDFHFFNKNDGFAIGYNGLLQKTANGGKDWAQIKSNTKTNLVSIHFVDKQHGWVCSDNGELLSTVDGGKNWKNGVIQKEQAISDICFTDTKTGYATGLLTKILKTTDGGLTWNLLNTSKLLHQHLYSIHFVDSETGFFTGTLGYIIRTTDGGKTFEGTKMDVSTTITRITSYNKKILYAVGSFGQLCRSIDYGKTWENLTHLAPFFGTFWDISSTGNGSFCLVGDYGTILQLNHKDDSLTIEKVKKNKGSINDINLHLLGKKIHFHLPEIYLNDIVEVKIFNLQGRLVIKKKIHVTKQLNIIELTELISKGSYILKLQKDNAIIITEQFNFN